MAYDAKDPADKKIVADAVAAALVEAAEEHEAAVVGLKKKNVDLIKKLKDARDGKGDDPEEVSKLEASLEEAKKLLKVAEKTAKDAVKDRDTFKASAEVETNAARKLLVDNGLTEALIAAGVKKEFLPAVRKLLADKVTVKVEGENRVAVVGDKPLGDFVTTWKQSDEGKHYIAAPANGGGGAQGGKGNLNGVDLSKLSPIDRLTAARAAVAASAKA
jgi:hypothetical protein